jgi:hypothetical protein
MLLKKMIYEEKPRYFLVKIFFTFVFLSLSSVQGNMRDTSKSFCCHTKVQKAINEWCFHAKRSLYHRPQDYFYHQKNEPLGFSFLKVPAFNQTDSSRFEKIDHKEGLEQRYIEKECGGGARRLFVVLTTIGWRGTLIQVYWILKHIQKKTLMCPNLGKEIGKEIIYQGWELPIILHKKPRKHGLDPCYYFLQPYETKDIGGFDVYILNEKGREKIGFFNVYAHTKKTKSITETLNSFRDYLHTLFFPLKNQEGTLQESESIKIQGDFVIKNAIHRPWACARTAFTLETFQKKLQHTHTLKINKKEFDARYQHALKELDAYYARHFKKYFKGQTFKERAKCFLFNLLRMYGHTVI